MNGPEHYLEADRILRDAKAQIPATGAAAMAAALVPVIQMAQVHATLALAAATAMTGFYPEALAESRAWDRVAGVPMPGDDDD